MACGSCEVSVLKEASSARPSDIKCSGKKGWVNAVVNSSCGGCGDFVLEMVGSGEVEVIWQLTE